MTYEIEFTLLGRAFAEAHSSLAAVEERARKELAELGANPMKIMFHVVSMGSERGENDFICFPRGDRMVIDAVVYEEMPPIESGPFKGKKVEMPRPASED